jgi:hypothetical protein
MPSLLSHLDRVTQKELLDDLNYLNMGEIKTLCKDRSIPYTIWFETENNDRRNTFESDRKGVILSRLRHYLKTGSVLDPTCFPASVVCFEKLSKMIKSTDNIFYGQYEKKNAAMIALLSKLTDGEFKDGATARILLNEFWRKGVAPTYQEYAVAWLEAKLNHKRPNPEWAFLSDRADGKDTKDWKQLRAKKAKRVLQILSDIECRTQLGSAYCKPAPSARSR